jgi:hypothetical protein
MEKMEESGMEHSTSVLKQIRGAAIPHFMLSEPFTVSESCTFFLFQNYIKMRTYPCSDREFAQRIKP